MARRLTIEEATRPIVATCGRCGAEGLIIANPPPRGSFQCPECNTPALARPTLLEAIRKAKEAGA